MQKYLAVAQAERGLARRTMEFFVSTRNDAILAISRNMELELCFLMMSLIWRFFTRCVLYAFMWRLNVHIPLSMDKGPIVDSLTIPWLAWSLGLLSVGEHRLGRYMQSQDWESTHSVSMLHRRGQRREREHRGHLLSLMRHCLWLGRLEIAEVWHALHTMEPLHVLDAWHVLHRLSGLHKRTLRMLEVRHALYGWDCGHIGPIQACSESVSGIRRGPGLNRDRERLSWCTVLHHIDRVTLTRVVVRGALAVKRHRDSCHGHGVAVCVGQNLKLRLVLEFIVTARAFAQRRVVVDA